MSIAERLYTAEEFMGLSELPNPAELIAGRVVKLNRPTPRHGEICSRVVIIVGSFVDEQRKGRVICNDAGILTRRNPDSVRGPDVAFFSFELIPAGPAPTQYTDAIPELVFEVRSASDRWSLVLGKVAEYLEAGVKIVCVLDPEPKTCHLYFPDSHEQKLAADQDLRLPTVLGPEFKVRVGRFFE